MARIVNSGSKSRSIMGGLSGKVGEFIYGNWKGIPYVRAKAVNVTNPKTAAQLDQRAKFTAIIKFLQPLTVFLRVGFKNDKAPMSPFNAAMSYNFKNAITGTYPDYCIDYSRARVSQGHLPGALNPKVRITLAGEIEYTWEDNSFEIDSMGNDKALLLVYNSSKQQAVFIVDGNTRYSGRQVITLPSTFVGDEVQCYIGFQNAKESAVSNSLFVGGLIVT